MYYIINKVLFNKENEEIEKKITCECLKMVNRLSDAIDYINNLKNINVFCEDVIIIDDIHNNPISNKHVDGYHLVVDDENTRKFNIYEKKSTLNKGYIYNSVDININYVGFIEIINYQVNKISLKKKVISSSDETDTSSESEVENSAKRKRIDNEETNHIYVELNDKMLNELKNKLENLSLKKNN